MDSLLILISKFLASRLGLNTESTSNIKNVLNSVSKRLGKRSLLATLCLVLFITINSTEIAEKSTDANANKTSTAKKEIEKEKDTTFSLKDVVANYSSELGQGNNSYLYSFEFLLLAIAFVLFFIKPKTKEEEEEGDIIQRTIKQSNQINRELSISRRACNADYVSISLFHNGTVTFNRIHLLKTTRLFESCGDKVVSRMLLDNKSFSLQPFYSAILEIINSDFIYVADVDVQETSQLKTILEMHDIKSVLYTPVYSKSQIVGFICYEWLEKTELTTEEINKIRNDYKNIKPFLEL